MNPPPQPPPKSGWGPAGNGIGGPKMQKIENRIGGPTVYKRVFMNFTVGFAKSVAICIGLTIFTLPTIDFRQKSLIYIDFGSNSIFEKPYF